MGKKEVLRKVQHNVTAGISGKIKQVRDWVNLTLTGLKARSTRINRD